MGSGAGVESGTNSNVDRTIPVAESVGYVSAITYTPVTEVGVKVGFDHSCWTNDGRYATGGGGGTVAVVPVPDTYGPPVDPHTTHT